MREFLVQRREVDLKNISLGLEFLRSRAAKGGGDEERLQEGWLSDGSFFRVLFPERITDPWEDCKGPLEVVCFNSLRPGLHLCTPDHSLVSAAVCEADERVREAMSGVGGAPVVVAGYLSMQAGPGKDFYNLVVFRPGYGADDFRGAAVPAHADATARVASRFYRRVWIHRLRVDEGITVAFKRTLVAEYDRGKTLAREIILWD